MPPSASRPWKLAIREAWARLREPYRSCASALLNATEFKLPLNADGAQVHGFIAQVKEKRMGNLDVLWKERLFAFLILVRPLTTLDAFTMELFEKLAKLLVGGSGLVLTDPPSLIDENTKGVLCAKCRVRQTEILHFFHNIVLHNSRITPKPRCAACNWRTPKSSMRYYCEPCDENATGAMDAASVTLNRSLVEFWTRTTLTEKVFGNWTERDALLFFDRHYRRNPANGDPAKRASNAAPQPQRRPKRAKTERGPKREEPLVGRASGVCTTKRIAIESLLTPAKRELFVKKMTTKRSFREPPTVRKGNASATPEGGVKAARPCCAEPPGPVSDATDEAPDETGDLK